MCSVLGWLSSPWPWYVAGLLIGLFVPALLLIGNKPLGSRATPVTQSKLSVRAADLYICRCMLRHRHRERRGCVLVSHSGNVSLSVVSHVRHSARQRLLLLNRVARYSA